MFEWLVVRVPLQVFFDIFQQSSVDLFFRKEIRSEIQWSVIRVAVSLGLYVRFSFNWFGYHRKKQKIGFPVSWVISKIATKNFSSNLKLIFLRRLSQLSQNSDISPKNDCLVRNTRKKQIKMNWNVEKTKKASLRIAFVFFDGNVSKNSL